MEEIKKYNILITGGAGFIGSHLVRHFVNSYPNYHIYNLDSLTYAGSLENLRDVEDKKNYTFIKGDITNQNYVYSIFDEFMFDRVIHLAAESHVDRSISNPMSFVKTNILGTVILLNAFKKLWHKSWKEKLFFHISTDEVYGSLGKNGYFTESSAYKPNSPYSASKASSDHFVRSYGKTYLMPYVISNCSNNFGENQFPEKLIPLLINNIINNLPLTIYGDGKNSRDWLYVKDHVDAIDLIFHNGKNNSTYNIGGFNQLKNIELAKILCKKMDEKLGYDFGRCEKLIVYVEDRPGHDLRYAIDSSKICNEFGWKPKLSFGETLSKTIDWYLNNQVWVENIRSGNFKSLKNNHI